MEAQQSQRTAFTHFSWKFRWQATQCAHVAFPQVCGHPRLRGSPSSSLKKAAQPIMCIKITTKGNLNRASEPLQAYKTELPWMWQTTWNQLRFPVVATCKWNLPRLHLCVWNQEELSGGWDITRRMLFWRLACVAMGISEPSLCWHFNLRGFVAHFCRYNDLPGRWLEQRELTKKQVSDLSRVSRGKCNK